MPVYAKIVFPVPIDREFHYAVPPLLEAGVKAGVRVKAPFGKQKISVGWCVGLTDTAGGLNAANIKEILEVVDPDPMVDEKMLKLTRAVADDALCSWGEALNAAVPAGARKIPKRPRKNPATPPPKIETAATGEQHPAEITMTPEQSRALAAVEAALREREGRTILLHGVTGSGKTEVYLRAISGVVAQGRQAIVLVPEISLTPQTIGRFSARFRRIAVLHSHLTDAVRSRHWRAVRAGEIDIVIGARSAIFAPCRDLGLIVIDEEHETSYKQESTPRYHVRDVALERARLEGTVLLLGTATPSLESYRDAEEGRFDLLELPERVEKRPLPEIEIVDMNAERAEVRRFPVISRRLKQLIDERVKNKEQSILFINRRGYTNYISCRRCAWVLRCKACDLAMTFHKIAGRATCHHCGEERILPPVCPSCNAGEVTHFGVGTERIEEEIRAMFPELKIARMDSDTMTGAKQYEESLGGVWSGETDILVGTQMIAKGLHIPNVTLVGVVSADTAFHLPDFRAGERTFQHITQVAGRAGRGPKGGRVVVQTFNPTHFSIQCAARYDYGGFVKKEMGLRRQLGYPPFSRLIRMVVESGADQKVRLAAETAAATLKEAIDPNAGKVLGPVLAPLSRIRGQLRMQVMLKCFDWETCRRIVRDLFGRRFLPGGVRLTIDPDPVNVM